MVKKKTVEDRHVNACVKLLREYGATEIYLFGSRATGSADANSDYDFAVRGVPSTHLYLLISQLEKVAEHSVDLILLDSDTDFSRHIETKIANGWAVNVG